MSVFPTSVLPFAHFRCPRIQSGSISLTRPNQQSCVIRFPAWTQWLRCCCTAHYRCHYSLRTWLTALSRQWLPVSEILTLELMTFQNRLDILPQHSNFNIPRVLCPRLICDITDGSCALMMIFLLIFHSLLHQIFI